MRITIDIKSVNETSRLLLAAADEYDQAASALQVGDGLGGVTGSERGWLLPAVESVAGRIRAVSAEHRRQATELSRRACCCADTASPVYAGIAVAGAQIAFDYTGDGINDTIAVDQDGDGYYESFLMDVNQDGDYGDLTMISDTSGRLVGAGFGYTGSGFSSVVLNAPAGPIWGFGSSGTTPGDIHFDSVVGLGPTGWVSGSDPDYDGTYQFTPIGGGGASVIGGGLSAGTLLGTTAIIGGNSTQMEIIPPGSAGYSAAGGLGTIGGNIMGNTVVGGTINPPGLLGIDPGGIIAGSNFADTWMDNQYTQEPSLGSADTYRGWATDPTLDTDHDGINNLQDAHVRSYDDD